MQAGKGGGPSQRANYNSQPAGERAMAASADTLRIVIVEDDPMMQLGLE
jgi:hypothetical protein